MVFSHAALLARVWISCESGFGLAASSLITSRTLAGWRLDPDTLCMTHKPGDTPNGIRSQQ